MADNVDGVNACLVGVAAASAGQGRLRRTAKLLGASMRDPNSRHMPKVPLQRRAYNRTVADLCKKLDKAALSEALKQGRLMTTQEAIAYALSEED
jgi:hypothetical protein